MTKKTAQDYKQDYTKPDLRERLKEQIKQDDKGGKSGQWSARKSQILKREYEEQGGGYQHPGQRTDDQKNLCQWSKEDWQTSTKENAIQKDQTTRYLPKKVWDDLSDEERKQADATKVAGSKHGQQYVDNSKSTKRKVKDSHKSDLTT